MKIIAAPNTFRKIALAMTPAMFAAVFLLLSHRVEATNKFWVAAGPGNFNDNANWSLTSGGPPNTTAPGASDVAFFDGSGLGNCTIAASVNVDGITIANGYSGTVTVASGAALTVGGTGLSQSAGTFNGGNSDIDINGGFLLKGTGVFNATAATLFLGSSFDHNTSINPGGTFNHNNGTVTFGGSFGGIDSELSGTVFNNVNFNHTGQRTVFSRMGGGPTITVLGALALNDGQLFGQKIEARGALTISPNFDGAPVNHATLVIANGGGPRTITFAAGTNMLNVTLNDPNATIQTSGGGALNWRVLTLGAGTVNQGGVDFVFPPGLTTAYSQSGGTFNGGGNPITFNSAFERFDPQDAVEFYGLGLDSPFTDSRTYWLVADKQAGLRVQQVKADAEPAAAQSVTHTVERRDRSVYFAALRNGERENFFGAVVAQNLVDQDLTLAHLANSPSDARLEIALQGVTLVPHRISVEVNQTFAGELTFTGQAQSVAAFSLPHSLLKEGSNSVRLTALEGPADISLVDYLRVSYPHTFTADNDRLKFTAPGNQAITVDGFTSNFIRVFDVTDANAPQEIIGQVHESKAGYGVSFAAPQAGERTLLVCATELSPARLWLNAPSSLRQANADFIIITPRDFAGSLGPLVALRKRQGLAVVVVDVEDVYDEFGFGHKSPHAVREFLSFARSNWKRKPRFVLFAGDASYNPKNYLGLGDFDLVPTRLVDTEYLEAASDDWFSDFDGDGIADFATGRLPARTPAEVDVLVGKLIAYEAAGPSEEALLVADQGDSFDFAAANQDLLQLIPARLRASQVNRGRVGDAEARRLLTDGIHRKQMIVNYAGHGSVSLWRGGLLTNDDAPALANGHLPLFVMMTCLNGYFADPGLDALAEALMKSEHGAIAAWASSGMTQPAEQAVMNQELYRQLFTQGRVMPLGEAVMRAKAAVADADIRKTWVLLGDPTLRLK